MTSGHATAASYEGSILMTKMRDPEGHRVMQAAGEAWKKIKTRGARTWTEWTEVIGPGLVRARAEAQSISNAPSGKRYNTAMGALLEEYGFGNTVERFRSKVERADLLHCMDYLTEIEEWRERAKRSVLEPIERKQHQHYPSHIALNHPTVVWRHFKASKDGKEAFEDRGIEPKLRAPKKTDDLRQELAAKQAYIEELEAARPPATEPAAEPTAVPVAIAEAVTSDIQVARSNYVTLLPTDHDARREELVAIIGAATEGWSDQDKIKACLAITHHIRDVTSASRA
jgi:hypothetical protein